MGGASIGPRLKGSPLLDARLCLQQSRQPQSHPCSETVHHARVQGHMAECKISRETQVFKLYQPTLHPLTPSLPPSSYPERPEAAGFFIMLPPKCNFREVTRHCCLEADGVRTRAMSPGCLPPSYRWPSLPLLGIPTFGEPGTQHIHFSFSFRDSSTCSSPRVVSMGRK